jgi:hypothetical protein
MPCYQVQWEDLQPKIFFWNGFLSNYHKSPPRIWTQPQLTITSSSLQSASHNYRNVYHCHQKMNTFNSTNGRGMFHHWTAFTTACLAWSSITWLPGLSHFSETISKMHSHLHCNKTHNIIISSYNTSCLDRRIFANSKNTEWSAKWALDMSQATSPLSSRSLNPLLDQGIYFVTPSVNFTINFPSKL